MTKSTHTISDEATARQVGKSPAFQFYPADWLSSSDVALMTLEEEGAYIRLLCYCWNNGSLPTDVEMLAKLIGKGGSTTASTNIAKVVAKCFAPHPEDSEKLIHLRLEKERKKQQNWREKSREGGKKSADKRKKAKDLTRVVQPDSKGGSTEPLQPKGNSSSSSSSLSSTECTSTRTMEPSKEGLTQVLPNLDPKRIPTLQQTKDFAPQAGIDPEIAETWWHDMEGSGWLDRNSRQVVRWQNTLTSYARKWQSNENRYKPHNGRAQEARPKSKYENAW